MVSSPPKALEVAEKEVEAKDGSGCQVMSIQDRQRRTVNSSSLGSGSRTLDGEKDEVTAKDKEMAKDKDEAKDEEAGVAHQRIRHRVRSDSNSRHSRALRGPAQRGSLQSSQVVVTGADAVDTPDISARPC